MPAPIYAQLRLLSSVNDVDGHVIPETRTHTVEPTGPFEETVLSPVALAYTEHLSKMKDAADLFSGKYETARSLDDMYAALSHTDLTRRAR